MIAPWVMDAFGYGSSLAVGLARVLFPIVVLLGLTGIVVGILNSYDEFSIPALTPVFWNAVIIVGLVVGVPRAHATSTKLYVYAVSIVVATLVQLLLPMPWLRGKDDRLHVVLDWRDAAVRRTFALMVPITIGLGLINFNAFIDTLFAARLIDKNQAPSAINAAFRLYIFPQGMFSVAVATVLFISFPITTFSAIAFGAISGLTWLSTVPPTSALVALMFGTRWLSTLYGFAFVSHQVGGFLGVWLGGIVFERFGSYTPIWWLSILFGVLSALINLPIVEKPVDRAVAQPA